MMRAIVPLFAGFLLSGCAVSATLTESQEYYSGRAAAAKMLSQFKLYQGDDELIEYVNLVGLLLSRHSERPEVFNGYHFIVLQADQVNAFAAPGGFIFLTTEAIRLCENEDELAGLIAHELSHVEKRHPELAYRKEMQLSGIANVIAWLAESSDMEGAEKFGETIDGFADAFSKGYGRDQEFEADLRGAEIMASAGYDPEALHAYLKRLTPGSRGGGGLLGWLSSTHPRPGVRAGKVRLHIGVQKLSGSVDPRRTERFLKHTRRLKGDE